MAILVLGACGKTGETEPGDANIQGTSGSYCTTNPGLSMTASIPNAPPGKFVGYVNGVLAFDECTSPDANGFYGANGFQFKRTASSAALYNSNLSYPQPGHQISVRLDYKLLCGTGVVQSGTKSVPLTDHGGCYSAQYAP